MNLIIAQCSYARLTQAIDEWQHLICPDDRLILLEDAVFALQNISFVTNPPLDWKHILIFQTDLHLIPSKLCDKIQTISYDDLSHLIIQSDKVINWK